MVRVNIPSSPHYLEDIEAALACDINGVVIPKLETTDQLYPVNKWIELLDKNLHEYNQDSSLKGSNL